MKKYFSCPPVWISLFLLLILGCVNPIEPEFEFKEGLIFIDAFASASPGTSFVKLRESRVDGIRYSTNTIENADVTFINTSNGSVVQLTAEDDSYIPPNEFAIAVGETWQLNIVLPDGTRYSSLSETVIAPVAIDVIKPDFESQLIFRDDSEEFVAGHSISVSFNDPPDSENFYFWRFTSFETLLVCATCENSALRDNVCGDIPSAITVKPYFSYLCDDDCWRIRFNENIKIFSDEFTNGLTINSLPVADVLLYSKEDIVVQVQQFSLSESAYRYYKVLEDIVDNTGSFNAPPSAALIGNLFNPDDDQEFVLGRFTAAAATTQSIFINRTDIEESIIDAELPLVLENSTNPLIAPVTKTECKESRLLTNIEPVGWIDN